MVDMTASEAVALEGVRVRVPVPAPFLESNLVLFYGLIQVLFMEPDVTLTCPECGISFSKPAKSYRKNNKVGRATLCGSHCVATYSGKIRFGPTVGFGFYARTTLNRANARGLPYDLDAEFLMNTFVSQNGLCAISGLPMIHNTRRRKSLEKSPYYASVDRLDSSKGYLKGNVQFVCLAINYMRNTFSVDQTLDFISNLRKRNAFSRRPTKIVWPSVEDMSELVLTTPVVLIARKLGVSDVAVAKFCNKNGIERRSRGGWTQRP
jgi:hypothetical protein